jgi:hypothetical protein
LLKLQKLKSFFYGSVLNEAKFRLGEPSSLEQVKMEVTGLDQLLEGQPPLLSCFYLLVGDQIRPQVSQLPIQLESFSKL